MKGHKPGRGQRTAKGGDAARLRARRWGDTHGISGLEERPPDLALMRAQGAQGRMASLCQGARTRPRTAHPCPLHTGEHWSSERGDASPPAHPPAAGPVPPMPGPTLGDPRAGQKASHGAKTS